MSAPPNSQLLARATHRQVAAGGVRFSLYRADPLGHRPAAPALLLHGVPQTAICWRNLLTELAVDRIVLAPDLKGLGGSEARGSYDVPTLVRELAALVVHEVDGPVDVVGHDWGGVLGLGLAGARPDLVRRLVVVSAPFRQLNLLRAPHVALLAVPLLPEAVFAAGGRPLISALLRAGWKSSRPLDRSVLAHYVDAYADPARIRAMLAYYRAALTRGRTGGQPPLPQVRVERHLVVWGAKDPVLPISVGESVMRDLGPDTTFITVPGSGHFVVEEAPDVVVPAIADFLRAGGTPRSRPVQPSATRAGTAALRTAPARAGGAAD